MAQAKNSKKKISKAMGEILKAPKKVEKAVKQASREWNDLEEFRQSVIDSGQPLNAEEEYAYYTSDPENFKKTNTYKNLQ